MQNLNFTFNNDQGNLKVNQIIPSLNLSSLISKHLHFHSIRNITIFSKECLIKPNVHYLTYFSAIQAILFYTPRWLWKGWEGGKIHALMMDLDIGLCSEVEKKQKKKMLLDYLWENLRFHNWWAYRYYLCEVLALANVIGKRAFSFFTFLFSFFLFFILCAFEI